MTASPTEFTVSDPAKLLAAGKWASLALPKGAGTLPVMHAMKLTAEGEEVRLAAFDYTVSARASVPAMVAEPGVLFIPGAKLVQVLGKLPAGKPVMFTRLGTRVQIVCGGATFTLAMIGEDDYPSLPEITGPAISIMARDLGSAVTRVATAAGDATEIHAALFMEFGDGEMLFTSTDTTQLGHAVRDTAPVTSQAPPSVMVPATIMDHMVRALAEDSQVEVTIMTGAEGQPKGLGIQCSDGREFTTLVTAGQYLPYSSLLNKPRQGAAIIDRVDLLGAAERAALVCTKPGDGMELTIQPGEILVLAEGGENGEDVADEAICADYGEDGPEIRFKLNPLLVIKALHAIDDERIHIGVLVEPFNAFVFTAHREGEVTYCHLVQPYSLAVAQPEAKAA
jgi:DNA polymerase-3 subunit beta